VDVLLGSRVFSKVSVEDIAKHPEGTFKAINTLFGWVVFGGTGTHSSSAVALRKELKPSLDELLSGRRKNVQR